MNHGVKTLPLILLIKTVGAGRDEKTESLTMITLHTLNVLQILTKNLNLENDQETFS